MDNVREASTDGRWRRWDQSSHLPKHEYTASSVSQLRVLSAVFE
jgi:hypothetical protein